MRCPLLQRSEYSQRSYNSFQGAIARDLLGHAGLRVVRHEVYVSDRLTR